MKLLKLIFAFTLTFTSFNIARTKVIEKTFAVKPSQKIVIESDLGYSKIAIKSWDKNEVYVKVKVNYTSSDHEYEKNVIQSYDVVGAGDDSEFSLSTKKISDESSYSSFLGIKYRIGFYERKDLEGEIYVPKENSFKSKCSYSSISLENMKGEIEFYGTGNTLEIRNSLLTKNIENNYGKTKLDDCSGNLHLKCISGSISITNLSGQLTIDGNYSDINLDGIKQNTVINSVSAKHSIKNIGGNLYVKSNYSTINIEEVDGLSEVYDVSGSVSIKKSGIANIDANYSNIYLGNIGEKHKKDINIKSTSGKLTIEDALGNLNISNPYSTIVLRNIRGDINLSGTSSSVYAEKIIGDWNSKIQYTKLQVHELQAKNVKITNRSDLVEIDMAAVPMELDIKNEYGNINVNIPQGFAGEIDMGTAYGKIATNLPIKTKEMAGSSIAAGKIGTGHGKIFIENKSSDILLNQKSN